MRLDGPMGERFDANLQNWLLAVPYANPGMLQIYARRNQSHQEIIPWYGEFSGKYLTSVAQAYAIQPNAELKKAGDYVVSVLAREQDVDGYLGVWPDSEKLNGRTTNGQKTWDAWSHYHNMLGLYLWGRVSNNQIATAVLNRAAECLYDFYIIQENKLDEDKGGTDVAIGHIFAILYRETKDPRYLEMVQKTFATFEGISGGDYFRAGLQNKPFYKMNRTRWESLHAIQTIAQTYYITKQEEYRRSFENIWDGIRRYDRHNTGGFSSGECAVGNPYDLGAIETCCTIAWMALSQDMLMLSDRSYVADEIELTLWNALLGAQHYSGRSFTYNTPMIGDKKSSAHEIVFQATAGSAEVNCCSVNGPRGLSMIGDFGVLVKDEQITVNYYGASEIIINTSNGHRVQVTQTGDYPFGDNLRLTVVTDEGYKGDFRLRIPFWSEETLLIRNGVPLVDVVPGVYFVLKNIRCGDVIDLKLDFRPHFWQGNLELVGKTSLYIGPILLAYDQRFNEGSIDVPHLLRLSDLVFASIDYEDIMQPKPYKLVQLTSVDGISMKLCDFASAGQTGTLYTTWLPTEAELPILWESSDEISWGQRLKKE